MSVKSVYLKISKRIEDFKNHPLTKNNESSALFRYVLFNVIQNINPKPRVYQWMNHLKFYAQKGDAGIVANIYYKLFDYEDSMFLIDHLDKDDLFIDVGANVGHYSLLAAGICGCEVMAFEPVPLTFSKLNKNVQLNDLTSKIKTFNIGIGDEDSFLNFTTNKDVMNSVAQENDRDVVRIEVRQLNTILKNRNPVFLKIDVEGFEYFVLKGATDVLANVSLKFIIIELNYSTLKFGHTNQEIFDFLISFNFMPIRYDVDKKRMDIIESYNEDKFNTIFVRKNLADK
jgi:FkbM family methyltransferase